jgi:natural product precursor
MKKLKLQALELQATEILSREQLKNFVGGSSGSGYRICGASCVYGSGSWSYSGAGATEDQCDNDAKSYCQFEVAYCFPCAGQTFP